MDSDTAKGSTANGTDQNEELASQKVSTASIINLNRHNLPTIAIRPDPDAITPTSHNLSQPSFLDNQFGSDSLQNGPQAIVPRDRYAKDRGISAGPGQTLSYMRPTKESVSGSDDDRSEDIAGTKTIKSDDRFGLGSLNRPVSSSKSDEQANRKRATESSINSPVDSLSGVEGAGSGLSLSHPDPGQIESDFDQLGLDPVNLDLTVQSVSIQISQSMCKSVVDGDEFLPADQLDKIINPSTVRCLLRNNKPGQSEDELSANTREVLKARPGAPLGRRRIFATLISMHCIQYIFDFIKADVDDSNLPLTIEWNRNRNNWDVFRHPDLAPLRLCDTWEYRDRMLFQGQQMAMLAPIFQQTAKELKNYKLTWKTIRPFLEHTHITTGGYGKVYKVKIHPAHHDFLPQKFYSDENQYFASKQLLDVNERDQFHEEVEILKRFSSINTPHPHLIQLLMTYQHRDNYYLLFHWAQSNLKEYWKKHPHRSLTPQTFRWFIKQCLGIASGLQQIHRVKSGSAQQTNSDLLGVNLDAKSHGRHGDIKPENILCFHTDGDIHLVITDFGLSRYHSPNSLSKSQNVRGYSGTYRPPECDSPKSWITQRYDMWTLGCLFLEFVSWLVLGNEKTEVVFAAARKNDDENPGADSFREDKFFNLDAKGQAKVKVSVINWMSEIRGHKNCPLFAAKVLDLIEGHLLLPNSKDRWECSRVRQELEEIQTTLHDDLDSPTGNSFAPHSQDNQSLPATENNAPQYIQSFSKPPAAVSRTMSQLTTSSSMAPETTDTTPFDTQLDSDLISTVIEKPLPSLDIATEGTSKKASLDSKSQVVKSVTDLDELLKEFSQSGKGIVKKHSNEQPPVSREPVMNLDSGIEEEPHINENPSINVEPPPGEKSFVIEQSVIGAEQRVEKEPPVTEKTSDNELPAKEEPSTSEETTMKDDISNKKDESFGQEQPGNKKSPVYQQRGTPDNDPVSQTKPSSKSSNQSMAPKTKPDEGSKRDVVEIVNNKQDQSIIPGNEDPLLAESPSNHRSPGTIRKIWYKHKGMGRWLKNQLRSFFRRERQPRGT